jgi:hypothetical protein
MKMLLVGGRTDGAISILFSSDPRSGWEHFQGCGLSFARKSRSVTRRTLRYNRPYPDFDPTHGYSRFAPSGQPNGGACPVETGDGDNKRRVTFRAHLHFSWHQQSSCYHG